MNVGTSLKGRLKTAFEAEPQDKVVVILDANTAGQLGRLIKWAIRKTQRGELVEQLPGVSFLKDIDVALQVESFVLDECDPFLMDAIHSLSEGGK